MKREGRQHGMVRAYPVAAPAPWLSSAARHVPRYNAVYHPNTAGRFTLVPSRPTNHSKFTGRYVRSRWSTCHDNPACKPRDKAKGAHKLRLDVASSCRLVSGVSASRVLDFLGDDCVSEEGDDDHPYDDEGEGEGEGDEGLVDRGGTVVQAVEIESRTGSEIKGVATDDDDNMSFCEVGFVCDLVDGDEGWCVVGDLWTPERRMMGDDDL